MTPPTTCRTTLAPHALVRWSVATLLALLMSSAVPWLESDAASAKVVESHLVAKPLASPAPRDSREPVLAAMADGRIAMSWLEPAEGTRMAFRMAVFNGKAWSRPSTIAVGDSFFVNWADVPSIRPLGGERFAAHWLWRSGKGTYAYDVRVSQSEDGGHTWSPPVTPHRDRTASEHGFASLVADTGGVLAVWLDGRKTEGHGEDAPGPMPDMTLRAASIAADGRLHEETELDGRTCDCCPTAAVMTDRGVLVAYRDRSPDEVRDIYLTRREAGGWSSPQAVHADNWHIAGCPVIGPAIAALGSHVAVAWYTAAADSPRVYVAFSDDAGQRFGPPVRIDEGSAMGRVSVALLSDGSALATWLESSGHDALVRTRRVSVSGAPDAAITVARTSAARSSGCPRVLTTGRTTLIAWTEAGTPPQVKLASLEVR